MLAICGDAREVLLPLGGCVSLTVSTCAQPPFLFVAAIVVVAVAIVLSPTRPQCHPEYAACPSELPRHPPPRPPKANLPPARAGMPSVASESSTAPPPPKPLPNPSTGSANPSASLQALWGYMQPALDHIVRSPTNSNSTAKAPAIEVSYHMGIHTAVYNYFTSQSDSAATLGPSKSQLTSPAMPFARSDKAKASGTDLYEQLDRYYADVAREIFLGTPHDDSSLVFYLLPCFSRFSAGAQSVNRLLNYVNRHYVKRAVDEDKGWLRLADVFDAVAKQIRENESKEQIQVRIRARRSEELKKWGYVEGAPPDVLTQAEAYAEAASSPDRVVPLTSLAHRRFRIEVVDPLLAVPKARKGGKKKKPFGHGDKAVSVPPPPKGRLARAAKELLEREDIDSDEKRRIAGELAAVLRTVGIKVDHPLRKKLEKYAASHAP